MKMKGFLLESKVKDYKQMEFNNIYFALDFMLILWVFP